ncbi:MAG: hypothetical protein DRP38_09170, partial [Thermotogae bacterium]
TFIEWFLLFFPFFILVLDLYMLHHALGVGDCKIIIPAILLFIFSVAEIIVAFDEIHEHILNTLSDKKISRKVKSVIKDSKHNMTVKKAMELSLEKYPELKKYRRKLCHVISQVLSEEMDDEYTIRPSFMVVSTRFTPK